MAPRNTSRCNLQTFLAAKDLAKRYGTAVATIWAWAKDGRIPEPVRIPPGWTRWRLSDLEAFEASLAPAVPRAPVPPPPKTSNRGRPRKVALPVQK